MSAPFCSHGWLHGDCPYCKVQQLELQISEIRTAVWAVFSKASPDNDTPEWRALLKFFELQVADKRKCEVCEEPSTNPICDECLPDAEPDGPNV